MKNNVELSLRNFESNRNERVEIEKVCGRGRIMKEQKNDESGLKK